MKNSITRRNFIRSTAAAAAVFPAIVPSTVFGANPPSNRVTVGHIGVGGQGGGVLGGFLGVDFCQSVAVCDPFKTRCETHAKRVNDHYAARLGKDSYSGCAVYSDFREVLARDDIDAVVVATPDHWHVPISMYAVRAGKDVYCEKPLGISVEQNKALREAVHGYGAVFQYGTQQRCFNTHCAYACELIRNGYIGELKAINVVAPNGATGGRPGPDPVPEGFDYDMWLGPAPVVPYANDRVIGGGRWHIYDYALGFIAGWGAHPLDIAHWGYPHIPVEYWGTGRISPDGLFDTIVDWNVSGRYANGIEFTLTAGGDRTTFVGTEGWIAPSRGDVKASSESILKIKIKPEEIHLLQDNNHYRNFLACCRTRQAPASNIDSAVQSDIISHMGDIAIRLQAKIQWDPEKETIVGNETARRMLTRAMREPWQI